MSGRILIADDEKEIVELMELYLKKDGFEVVAAKDGEEALLRLGETGIDLAVLDIMMPGLDGFNLVRKIRERYGMPVIFLSARNGDNDKILGLGLGADDYMTKPFNPMELLARIHAQLRRVCRLSSNAPFTGQANAAHEIAVGDLLLNEDSCMLYKRGSPIQLTYTEYRIISLMMKNPDRVFTKKQIFESVRDEPYYADDNIVMAHISNLREKIEDNARNPVYLTTIRGLGYRLERTPAAKAATYADCGGE